MVDEGAARSALTSPATRILPCRSFFPAHDFAMDLFDLSSDVAVVIGATGVLGGAIAEGLAAAGATVAVVGRNEERGAARVKAITDAGGRAGFFRADALDHDELAASHQEIEKGPFGPPTVLVNAAGGNDSQGHGHARLSPSAKLPRRTGARISTSISSAARSCRARNSAPAWANASADRSSTSPASRHICRSRASSLIRRRRRRC